MSDDSLDAGYSLWGDLLMGGDPLPISKVEYDQIASCYSRITAYTNLEENFQVICETYRAVELFLFETSLDNMIYSHSETNNMHQARVKFSAHCLSFLAATKLYSDRACSLVSKVSSGAITVDSAKAKVSQSYDADLDFRVMVHLRNHSQHHSLLADTFSYGGSWNSDRTVLSSTTNFFLETGMLKENKGFKKTLIDELERVERKNFDLKRGTRTYFSALCAIHSIYRLDLKHHIHEIATTLSAFRDKWGGANGSADYSGLVAGRLQGAFIDDNIPRIRISTQLEEYSEGLARRTHSLTNMDKRRVAW